MAKREIQKETMVAEREGDLARLEHVIAELRAVGTGDRLLGLYELGIEGCAQHRAEQVKAVVEELIGTLDFEYADIAEGFHRIYTYCMQQAGAGEFDRVAFVLEDLRDTLLRAVNEPATEA